MKYNLSKLKNGLQVVTVPNPLVESATTLVLVGAGSRYENRKNNGISHFLEHMAFKGTKSRPTALEIASLMDGIGAESNAFTGKEYTGYYIKAAAKHTTTSLELLADMLSNLLLDKKEIEKERGVILEEINLYEDTPARKIGDLFEELLYGDVPMGWDIAGFKENIKTVTREDFVEYMQSLYSADNMIVLVAGKIDEDKTLATIDKYYGELPYFATKNYESVVEGQKKPQTLLRSKDTEQAHFALGVRTVGYQDRQDRYPLTLLSAILGGGMSSRLFTEIREKRGLAYYVRAYSERYLDVGYLSSFAGVDKNRIDDAIKVVIDEYQKISKKGSIVEKELEKAKEYISGHFVLDLEDTKSVAVHYGSSLLLENEIELPQETLAQLKAVTLDDIERVAQKYLLPEQLNLAVIGNFKDQSHFQKLLQ